MQALAQGLNEFSEEGSAQMLQKVAEDWAVFCLRANKGELLQRGLAISVAITTYLDGVQFPQNLKD